MKRFTTLLTLFAVCFMLAAGAHATPNGDKNKKGEAKAIAALAESEAAAVDAARWNAFNDNLVHALQSNIEGVKVAAMQLVIRYGDRVDVDKAVFDVVRLYRNNKNDDVRRMAVVTLGKMQHPWAMDLLKRSERFEKTPAVLKTVHAVVAEYYATRGGA